MNVEIALARESASVQPLIVVNTHASQLGKLGGAVPKTMSRAAVEQRRRAGFTARSGRAAAIARWGRRRKKKQKK